jgi:hypothetical protein
MTFFAILGIACCIVCAGVVLLALYFTWRDSDD